MQHVLDVFEYFTDFYYADRLLNAASLGMKVVGENAGGWLGEGELEGVAVNDEPNFVVYEEFRVLFLDCRYLSCIYVRQKKTIEEFEGLNELIFGVDGFIVEERESIVIVEDEGIVEHGLFFYFL